MFLKKLINQVLLEGHGRLEHLRENILEKRRTKIFFKKMKTKIFRFLITIAATYKI